MRSGQRLFQSVMRDQDQLYGNQTAQGLVQDMMLADLIARQRMMPDPATGAPGESQGPVMLTRVPIGLLQMLMAEGRGGDTANLLRMLGGGNGQDQSLQDIIQHIIENDPNRYGPPPASKSAISSLKKKQVQDYQGSKVECCVCLEKIADYNQEDLKPEDQTVIEMPCDHTFHEACLLPWLKQHNSCPSCRFELPTDDKDYERQKN